MNREELKKKIMGPVATVPTPFDDDFRVDLGKFSDLTRWWVESGIVAGRGVIKVAAAMGEGPELRESEWPPLIHSAVRAADGKAAIVCGIHYKDTLRTIEDAKRAQDLGAIGLQISPPVFTWPDQDAIIRHYGDISDAIDVGILVYVTRGLPGGSIYAETFKRMTDFEQLVGVKWGNPKGTPYEELFELKDVFNIFCNNGTPILNHKLGGKGYINHTSAVYPPHDLKIWDLMEDGRYDEAQALYDLVNDSSSEFAAKVGKHTGGEAVLVKGMMAVMGRPVGVSRPPSLPMNAAEITELHGIMGGWGWPVAPLEQALEVAG